MKQVDARGLLCPQPVVLTKSALEEQPDVIQVFVDNAVAGQNVSRFLAHQGYKVKLSAEGLDIIIEGHSEASFAAETAPTPVVISKTSSGKALFITRSVVGGNDAELGEVLIKALLSTVLQLEESETPQVVALMNEGVMLAIEGTSTADTLAEFVQQGGEVLVCGTCLKHFDLTDKLGVGTISNMYEILSALLQFSTVTI